MVGMVMAVGNKVVMEILGIMVVAGGCVVRGGVVPGGVVTGGAVVSGAVVSGAVVSGGGVEGGGEVVVTSAVPVDRYVALNPCNCTYPSVVISTLIVPPLDKYCLFPALSSPDRVAITFPQAQEEPSQIFTTS